LWLSGHQGLQRQCRHRAGFDRGRQLFGRAGSDKQAGGDDCFDQWHRRYRAESIGFGLAGLVTLFVPVLNLLIGPVLATGGTLLVIEFEEGVPAPDPADAGSAGAPSPSS